jgi:hypothetical protein
VAIVALGYSFANFHLFKDYPFGAIWLYWAFLWFLFFLLRGLKKTGLSDYVGRVTAKEGWVTDVIPAALRLSGYWKHTAEIALALGAFGVVVCAALFGISVDHDTDTNYYLDATLAYRRACLNAVEYFKKFGYSGEQAYLLLGSSPIEGRISGIVDIPNACCSLYVPTAMFDFGVRPTAAGPMKADRGQCALATA